MARETKSLTDAAVKAFKVKPGQVQSDLWDGRLTGLHLRASAGGTRTWYLRYRTPDGRNPRFALGRYPTVMLADAREAADRFLKQVARGIDPAMVRRQARHAPAGAVRTFDDLADRYETACADGSWTPKNKKKRDSVLAEEKRILAKNVRPIVGKDPFDGITRAQVKALLRDLQKPTKARPRPLGAQTNRTHAVIRQVFAFAISEELVQVNPAVGINLIAKEAPRERIWSDAELRLLWGGLNDPAMVLDDGKAASVGEGVCIALKLAMILGQRRGEIIGMARSELDLAARTWLIPKDRMKGARPHMVPLPAEAVALIERAMMIADRDRDEPSAYVFPTTRAEDRPIRPDSMSQGLRRLSAGLKIEGAHVHDLRRTVSTNLTSERCSVSPFIRSKILGHIDGGGGAMVSSTHYDRNSYLAEKRDGLERWTALLLEIVGERARPSNITPLREAVA